MRTSITACLNVVLNQKKVTVPMLTVLGIAVYLYCLREKQAAQKIQPDPAPMPGEKESGFVKISRTGSGNNFDVEEIDPDKDDKKKTPPLSPATNPHAFCVALPSLYAPTEVNFRGPISQTFVNVNRSDCDAGEAGQENTIPPEAHPNPFAI